MKLFLYSLVLIALLLFFGNNSSSADPKINYSVSMPFPSNHLYEVTVTVENYVTLPDDFIDFSLPAWRSGRYDVLDMVSGIQEFSAEDKSGAKLKWTKIDKDTWRVNGSADNSFVIKYKVYSNEFSIRTRGLNDECGFIDASAVLMFADKLRFSPLEVKVIPFSNWIVTTGLDNVSGSVNTFYAKDYDYLADCPLLVGNQQVYDFSIKDKKFYVAFPKDQVFDADKVMNDIKIVSEAVCNFWGEIPFEHYTYMLVSGSFDYGATEHINSTVFSISPTTFTNKDRYYTFLSNIAHEFFHTWNIKQLRPKSMDPYDFTKENYSREIWIAEGITSYYEYVFMLETGYLAPEKFFELIAGRVSEDIERPGNYVQTLSDGSFDAWVKQSAQTQNKYISETDYYRKGANLGLLTDLEIRHNSDNKYSLDDVMKTMLTTFPLSKGGYTNEDFIKVCEDLSGRSMKEFFDKYLYGLDTLDWKKNLGYAGLDLKITYSPEKPSIGISTRESGDRLYVSGVTPGSAGYDAGLDFNDEIIALNGYRVRSSSLNSRIADMQPGDEIKLTVMRDDKLREFKVTLKAITPASYKVEKMEDQNDLQEEIYKTWLKIN